MPIYDRNYESFIEYSQTLGEIEAFVNNKDASNLLFLRDFNADPTRGQLWKLVEDFCDDWGLRVADSILPATSFTYLSPCQNTTSWLDHILCGININVKNVKIGYDLVIFDHFPLFVDI